MSEARPGDVVRYIPKRSRAGRRDVWDHRESSGQLYLVVENYGETVKLYEPGQFMDFFYVDPAHVTVVSAAGHDDSALDALKEKRPGMQEE